MKKITDKFVKILMLVSMIFSSFQTPIQVFAQEKANNDSEIPVGSIKLGENGKIEESGIASTTVTKNGINVTKTVSKTDTLGKYHVKFEAKGTKTETSRPVYVVVVFDRSGSMKINANGNQDISKWNNAVSGAKSFANSILTNIPNAKLGLVTFAEEASLARGFENANFEDVNNKSLFGSANGGTNLDAGLQEAQKLFQDTQIDEKALKYVVVMSDGEPTYYNGTCFGLFGKYTCTRGNGGSTDRDTLEATLKTADEVKKIATVYSIGYSLKSGYAYKGRYTYNGTTYDEDLTAADILTKVATPAEQDKKYYYSADDKEQIVKTFSDIANQIIKSGTNAQIIDKLGSNFKLVNDDNNNYGIEKASEVYEELSNDTITFEFDIEINPDASTGWHQTNDGFRLEYIDNNGVKQTINSEEDPYVYWKQKTYQYKVNYYKDSFKNEPFKTDIREAVKGTIIDIENVDKDKYLNEAGAGYEFNKINPDSIVITNDGKVKEINVLYTLKKFSYTVNYYKDNSNVAFESIKVDDVVYGKEVAPKEYYLNLQDNSIIEKYELKGYKLDDIKSDKNVVTIDSDNKVINVYYIKDMFKFTVNYYFDNNQDTELTEEGTKEYGSTIKASEYHLSEEVLNNKGNYFLDPDKNAYNYQEKKIGTNPDKNDLNIYYIKTEIPYGKESIKKTTTNNGVITDSKTVVNYTVNYEAVVNNVRKNDKIMVTIVDTLPAKIDTNNKSIKLNGGVYEEDNKTITWVKEITVEEDFVKEYSVNEKINYSVVYVDYADISASDNNKLINTVHGNVMVKNINTNGVEASTEVEVNIQGNLTVKHVDENGKDLLEPVLTTKAVGTTYDETKKEIYGYTFKEDTGNTSGKYIEGTTEVVFTYTKNDGTVTENEVVKTGPENITSVNGVFNYTLSYKGEIKDYVGDAKITLVDTLPYELDDGSTYEGCTYNAQDKTLTCERVFTISENNTKVEVSFALSLKFKNIDSDKITNKVESKLEYGNNHNEDEDKTETEVFKGTVVARYLDEDNTTVLAPSESSTGLGGSEYTTSEKTIYGYTFKEVQGNENGKYAAKETIYVDYIYAKNDGTVSETVTSKTQIKEISGINSEFEYVLSYNGKIEGYVGNATIKLTDKLLYTVKEIKYDENACSFNKDTNTLTCFKTVEIDEKNNLVNAEFHVIVKYLGLTSETDLTVKNIVNAELTYGNNKENSNDSVEDVIKASKVTAIYVDEANNTLADSEEMTGLIDSEYTTNEKTIYGYTLKEIPVNKNGVYTEEDIIVKYVYTKNDGTVTENSVVKTGPEDITSVNGVFNYTLTYKGEITDYTGTAKLTLIDRLPYELDDNSTYEGCTYNAQDKTLTCERVFTISENNTKVEVSFALSLKFKNIDSDKITNKVESKLEYGNNHEEDDDETETEVFMGTVIARYFDEEENVIAKEESSEGLGGSEYTTSKKDIYGYTYKTVVGEENGKYTAKETIYVDYIYTKNDGIVTENITTKDQINNILGSNSEFEYVLSYNGKIKDYKGNATITLTDKFPYTVKEIKYDENACSFNKDTNTLICIKTVKIDEENQEFNAEFRVVVKYLGLTSESDLTVKNKVEATLTYGKNETPSTGETEDVVKSSKVTAIYVDEDDNELDSSEVMTGLIDNEYTTHEKDILGYTLKEIPANKNGVYTEEEIVVKYVYTKNIGTSEEEVKKVGLEEVASINDVFIYTITYNAVVKDYVGDVKLVITDKLPYEIDDEKSVIDTNNDNITCEYIDSKIVCEYNKTIDSEEDNTIDVVINLELYFKNVDSDMVKNKVEADLTYGDVHKISKDETGTKVLSGMVTVNYITEDGEELALSEEMTGLVGEDYKTTKKAFDKYYLKEVKGNETGVYAEEAQEVTYVYSLIPLPPQTGYEGNNTNYIGLFILGIVILLFKKRI